MPVTRALAPFVQPYGLDAGRMNEIIDGMEMDVRADIRAPDQATLDVYCDRVACAGVIGNRRTFEGIGATAASGRRNDARISGARDVPAAGSWWSRSAPRCRGWRRIEPASAADLPGLTRAGVAGRPALDTS